jgi:hypothetical protein
MLSGFLVFTSMQKHGLIQADTNVCSRHLLILDAGNNEYCRMEIVDGNCLSFGSLSISRNENNITLMRLFDDFASSKPYE